MSGHAQKWIANLAAMAWGVALLPAQDAAVFADRFRLEVDRRLEVPDSDRETYGEILRDSLRVAGLADLPAQFVVLADRSPAVQAVMIFLADSGNFRFIGASPASTGKPGRFEHFETPVGVFDHSLDNPDFRAEGTRNQNGILGYGRKGMRVFDFGWVTTPKGWGDRARIPMRLQMHATDPGLLEPRLGAAESKGCIRIPASLNRFIDRYGILDAGYEAALKSGRSLWMLSMDRQPTAWPGRYLVIVDTHRSRRPSWSPAPTVR